MAKDSIKIRASAKGDVTIIKALIKHPMETGLRKDKATGEKIPAHFIQEVVCSHNGTEILTAEWSGSISKNPYLSFEFSGGATGDEVAIRWTDNKGDSDNASVLVK